MLEGEAEIVALAAVRGKPHLDSLTPSAFDLGEIESTLAGVANGLIYGNARIWALDRYRAEGFDGLRAAYDKAPSSSEQIMHPQKSGVDLPSAVTIPELGTGYIRSYTDTIGELQLRIALLTAKVNRRTAIEASIGWDGDLIIVLQDDKSKKSEASVWRSLWDREVDAQQFETVMNGLRKGGHKREMFVQRLGRAVDIVFSKHTPIAKDILHRLEGTLNSPEVVEADANSTAIIEEAALKALPVSKLDGSFWSHESFGLKIPKPDDWTTTSVGNLKILKAPLAKGQRFATNINVQAMTNGGFSDLEYHLETNRKQIDAMKSLDLDAIEIVDHAGVSTLRCEYHGRVPGAPIDLHFLCLIYMRGNKQVVVTLTTKQDEWKENQRALRKIMDDIKIEKQ